MPNLHYPPGSDTAHFPPGVDSGGHFPPGTASGGHFPPGTLSGEHWPPGSLLAEAVVLLRASQVTGWTSGDALTNEGTNPGDAAALPAVGAETGGPVFLDPADGAYQAVHTNTFSPSSFSTPDSTAIDIAGDIDLRAKWRTFADPTVGDTENRTAAIGRITNLTSDPGYDELSYELSIGVGGGPTPVPVGDVVLIWHDGTDQQTASYAAGLDPYESNEVRATLDVDNGAGGWTASFYVRDDADPDVTTSDGKGWRLLGTDSDTGTTQIRDTSGPLTAMSFRCIGTYAEVWDGIDGTLAASFYAADAAGFKANSGTFVSSETGETWTTGSESSVVPVPAKRFLVGFDEAGTATNASFSVADAAALDAGTADRTVALLCEPGDIADADMEVVVYCQKSSGSIGQGGAGWDIRDLRFDGFGVDGFGAAASDGTDTALAISNTGWTAARHLVVATMDRDGNLTTYVDGTARGTADMTAVGSISTSTALEIGTASGNPIPWAFEAYAEWKRALTDDEVVELATLL